MRNAPMERIKKWFRTVSRRLFVKLLLFLVLPNLLLLAVIHQLMMKQAESKAAEMHHTLIVLEHATGREMSALFDNVTTLINRIIIEPEVQRILAENAEPPPVRSPGPDSASLELLRHYENEETIRDILSQYRLVWNNVFSISIVDRRGQVFLNTAETYSIRPHDLESSELLKVLAASDSSDLVWSANDALTKRDDMITMARKIYGVTQPNRVIGYAVVNLSLDAVRDSFETYNYYDQMIFGVMNESRTTWMIYDDHRIEGGRGPLFDAAPRRDGGLIDVELMGRSWRMVLRQTETDDYMFVGLDAEYMSREVAHIRNGLLYGYASFLALAVFISLLGARVLSRRLGELMRAMRKFGQKEWGTRIEANGHDEIGIIGEQFNVMASHIEQLLSDVKEQQRKKRQFELRVLEYQINPHFLYNTLDSIHWLAFEEGQSRISEMVNGLSKLFRLILSKGKETIPLEQEFEMVRIYLHIQKIRFEDRFDYDIRLDPDVAAFPIGKLVLQPLVENALVHGIRKVRHRGLLIVTGERRGDEIVLEIADNGVGMTEEQVARQVRLLASEPLEDEPGATEGYGMKNVDARLKLMYGERYRFELLSRDREPTGTTARIAIRPDAGRPPGADGG